MRRSVRRTVAEAEGQTASDIITTACRFDDACVRIGIRAKHKLGRLDLLERAEETLDD